MATKVAIVGARIIGFARREARGLIAALLVSVCGCVPAQPAAVTAASLTLPTAPVATPTFECLGVVAPFTGDDNADASCTPWYRETGQAGWLEGHPLWADRAEGEFRGSLIGLRPGVTYEVELRFADPDGVSPAATVALTAQTWSERFPVAETVWVEPGTSTQTLRIEGSGSPEGYVLYSARPGRESETVIDVQGEADNNIVVNGDYVIVRGLALRNARTNAVDILKRHHVVIERCTITGWGRPGGRGQPGDLDAGIYARNGGSQIIIQDNVIREPRGVANPWTEGHPEGPQAISLIETDGNHVIRYNDLTSVEDHRYNDTCGGGWNMSLKGFPCRDTDIYGNQVAYCNDDGIELDGGDNNVRVWANRIEQTYCGISLAPVLKGPVYVWRNVITGFEGAAFKLGEGDRQGYGAVYLYHNTVFGPDRSGIADWGGEGLFRFTTSRNNILAVSTGPCISDKRADPTNSYDYDLLQGRLKVKAPVEPHGVVAKPGFVDPDGGVFLLGPQSAAVDAGIPLPGFNAAFRGRAPDLGAFELDDSEFRYGPRPVR